MGAPLALAAHTPVGRCDSGSQPSLGIVEVTGGTAATTFYLDDRNSVSGNGLWIYQESGGKWTPRGPGVYSDDTARHNVQRGGASPYFPDEAETCVDDPYVIPDIMVF